MFGTTDHNFSVGFSVNEEGELKDVLWEGPAFDAGLTTGSSILAVGGRAFDLEVLAEAIGATSSGRPLELTVKHGQQVRTVVLDYDGGARHPHLERIPGTPARIDDILAPRGL